MSRYLAHLAFACILASCAGEPGARSEPVTAEMPAPAKPHHPARQLPAPSIEGKRISEVAIRYTTPIEIDGPRLRPYISTHAGEPYVSEKVDDDIKALYESGYIDDVRVLAEPKGNEILLIYEVTPLPPMGPSGFIGNTTFSDYRLAKETRLAVGQELNPETLAGARARLTEFYRSQGFSRVKVEVAAYPGGPPSFFRIEEGPRSRG